MRINESFQLRQISTMKIGGAAEKILSAKTFLNSRVELPRPIRILGNGSNTLIDDHGLKGSVILTRNDVRENSDPMILDETPRECVIAVSAGYNLPALARWSVKRGWTGCEYMIGIPGTLGGALVQNAGANEQELSEILVSAKTFNLEEHQSLQLSKEECALGYRTSRFKTLDDPKQLLLIDSVTLRLKRAEKNIDLEKLLERNLQYRKTQTPYSKPSLGSVFTRLRDDKGQWLYPGKLIEECGLKGHKIGGASVSHIHANYIVNNGDATFDDVLRLIEQIERTVFNKTGVRMRREIVIWSDRI